MDYVTPPSSVSSSVSYYTVTSLNASDVNMTSLNASDVNMTSLPDNANVTYETCTWDVADAARLIKEQGALCSVATLVSWLAFVVILVVFSLEVVFVVRTFQLKGRAARTIWILALFPFYILCVALGVLVPRAVVLVDLIASIYLGTCLYQLVRLLGEYMGGSDRISHVLCEPRMRIDTAPCCCCCYCLPEVVYSRGLLLRLVVLTLQAAVVRPLLLFVAAILWVEGRYTPGLISADSPYVYVLCCGLLSSGAALWGLALIYRLLGSTLHSFKVRTKLTCLAVVLVAPPVGELLLCGMAAVGVLSRDGVVCAHTRALRVSGALTTAVVAGVALVARPAFLCETDGRVLAQAPNGLRERTRYFHISCMIGMNIEPDNLISHNS